MAGLSSAAAAARRVSEGVFRGIAAAGRGKIHYGRRIRQPPARALHQPRVELAGVQRPRVGGGSRTRRPRSWSGSSSWPSSPRTWTSSSWSAWRVSASRPSAPSCPRTSPPTGWRRSPSCSGSLSGPTNWSPSSTPAGTNRSCPRSTAAGIRIHREARLETKDRRSLDKYFRQAVFPVLTPMAIDPSHPSPRFHNRGLYLAAMLKRVAGHRAGATLRRRAGAPGVAALRVGRARRHAELRAPGRLDRLPPAGAVRRLRHRRPRHVPRHPRHGHQPAGARSGRHAAVDRVAVCGCGSGPRPCGWKSRPA